MGKNLLLSSLMLLGQFLSLPLVVDWGPWPPAGYWLETTLRAKKFLATWASPTRSITCQTNKENPESKPASKIVSCIIQCNHRIALPSPVLLLVVRRKSQVSTHSKGWVKDVNSRRWGPPGATPESDHQNCAQISWSSLQSIKHHTSSLFWWHAPTTECPNT